MELVKKNKKTLSTVRFFMDIMGAGFGGGGRGGSSNNPSTTNNYGGTNANCSDCLTNVACVNE